MPVKILDFSENAKNKSWTLIKPSIDYSDHPLSKHAILEKSNELSEKIKNKKMLCTNRISQQSFSDQNLTLIPDKD